LIYPFKLRRTKENVLPDLPAKVEDIRHCALSEEQVKMYRDIIALKAQPLVEALKDEQAQVPYLHVFATLTLLKQICNHPALIKEDKNYKKYESGKFELFKELLQEAFDSNHKVVVFSQYVSMIQIIDEYLTDIGVQHVVLTGQSRNRGDIIKKFQEDPNTKVFCGSLLAGGIGIDLTAASLVIHYDRWWNASKENQATDRVHRIGQQKNVQVLKLVTRGTLEEKIDKLIRAKAELFDKFVDQDEDIFKALSRHDLIELLQ
jgi:SNF2 family DNA or RNA helicase